MRQQIIATASFALLGASVSFGAAPQGVMINPAASRGIASGWPAGAIVTTPNSLDGKIKLKGEGNQSSAPADWAPVSGSSLEATYDLHAYVASIDSSFSDLEIDAMSTGNGVIPAPDETGTPQLQGNWMGVAVSIANGSTGAPNSHFRTAHNLNQSAGAEIATYYMSQSQGITNYLKGSVTLETKRSQFGLASNSATDIAAFDYGIGVITHDAGISQRAFFRNDHQLYFSVTREWAQAHQSPPFATDSTGATHAANATDIYVIEWSFITSSWWGPFIYADGATLGFDRAVGDLDALEVDPNNDVVIYSGRDFTNQELYGGSAYTNSIQSQLTIANLEPLANNTQGLPAGSTFENFTQGLANYPNGATGDLTPLRDGDEETVVTKLGLKDNDVTGSGDPDELDGNCTFDPEGGALGGEVGVPEALDPTGRRPMGLSLVQGKYEPSSTDMIMHVHLTGWGSMNPQTCRVALFYTTVPNTDSIPAFALGTGVWHVADFSLRHASLESLTFERPLLSGLPPQSRYALIAVAFPTSGPKMATPIGESWVLAFEE